MGFPKKSVLKKEKKGKKASPKPPEVATTHKQNEQNEQNERDIKLTCNVNFNTKFVKTFRVDDKEAPVGESVDLCGVCEEKFWEKIFLPNLTAIGDYFENTKPNLWITGHSLGAATASVFTSVLLWHKYRYESQNYEHDLFPQLGLDGLLKVSILYKFIRIDTDH